MDGRIVCCGIISSCQSAATAEIAKALLAMSSSHVKSVIASSGLYLFLNHNTMCTVSRLGLFFTFTTLTCIYNSMLVIDDDDDNNDK